MIDILVLLPVASVETELIGLLYCWLLMIICALLHLFPCFIDVGSALLYLNDELTALQF